MTEPHPHDAGASPPPAQPDRILAYRPPAEDVPARRNDGEAAAGCLLFAGAIPAGVFVTIYASYVGDWPAWAGLCVIGALVVTPVTLGLALRRSPRSKGFAAGLLVGVGVAALIEGICFFANWR
jgi:hypothetical protein